MTNFLNNMPIGMKNMLMQQIETQYREKEQEIEIQKDLLEMKKVEYQAKITGSPEFKNQTSYEYVGNVLSRVTTDAAGKIHSIERVTKDMNLPSLELAKIKKVDNIAYLRLMDDNFIPQAQDDEFYRLKDATQGKQYEYFQLANNVPSPDKGSKNYSPDWWKAFEGNQDHKNFTVTNEMKQFEAERSKERLLALTGEIRRLEEELAKNESIIRPTKEYVPTTLEGNVIE